MTLSNGRDEPDDSLSVKMLADTREVLYAHPGARIGSGETVHLAEWPGNFPVGHNFARKAANSAAARTDGLGLSEAEITSK